MAAEVPDPKPTVVDLENPKVRKLMQAAHELFMTHPYDRVSTDAISRKSGVSKATLYVYFNSKDELFLTLITELCREISDRIWVEPLWTADVKKELQVIAQHFLTLFASCHSLALYKSVIAQATRFPELGLAFYEAGPKQLQARLASYLEEATRRGYLHVTNPQIAAIQFLQLVAADAPMRGLLGLNQRSKSEVDDIAERAIELFLRGSGFTEFP